MRQDMVTLLAEQPMTVHMLAQELRETEVAIANELARAEYVGEVDVIQGGVRGRPAWWALADTRTLD